MKTIRNWLSNVYFNISGLKTTRNIIVIESDDWGSNRMPSKKVFTQLLESGIRVDKCHYCKYDSIETAEDLSHLFDVLTSVKDKNGNPAILTANTVVVNPDFQKIKEANYNQYFYKKISEDFENKGSKLLELYRQGREFSCFLNQSHGREHLNVSRWMKYLKEGYEETIIAFHLGVYGISTTISKENRKSFLSAFDFENYDEESIVNYIAEDGLRIFEEIFGYKSKSFIAPNYTWGKKLESVIHKNGVDFIQGSKFHSYTSKNGQIGNKRLRPIGSISESGLINLSRNVHFEPSVKNEFDWVGNCLKQIEDSFKWRKPATISTHRVNYIGSIVERNRDNNLKLLDSLLKSIIRRWPNVEFFTSEKLGEIIKNKEILR